MIPGVLNQQGVAGWSPLSLDGDPDNPLRLWWDFSDPAQVTLSGSDITGINDQSSNNQDGSVPATRLSPTLASAAFNGRNMAQFDALTEMLTSTGFPTTTFVAVFMVVSRGASTADTVLAGNNGTSFWGAAKDGDISTDIKSAVYATEGTWYVNGVAFNTAFGAQRRNELFDAIYNAGGTRPRVMLQDDGYLSAEYGPGGYTSASWTPDYLIGEIIIIERPLNLLNANREKIEGYLAWKWGVQADLPAGHPYLAGPP